ncbi:MAG: AAA family ATPase [Candidatus Eremiobacteraeota bacterium]|nr:AAA family ATPase [Candidatus Eremiobacteraeota bacterium]
MEIRLFGGLELIDRGSPLKFSAPARAASLLAYLIMHQDRSVGRDDVAFLFWPDEDEARARANLRRHVALILRALPSRTSEAAILADNRTLRWNPQFACAVDVVEFERLSATDEGAADAARLYRGDLLPATYDEWVIPERERLRTMQAANLERLAERHAASGKYVEAIAAGKALLAHDPWREDALRRLISLRQAVGDRAGALQEYEAFAERLRRDLNVEPMPETVATYESIVRNAERGSATAISAATRASGAAVLPFVGRDGELARLRQSWLRAMRGFGAVATVTGEAGIGKSRLAGEFAKVATSRGGQVLAGSATFPETRPYRAIADALQIALPSIGALALNRMWLAAAAEVVPDLRDLDVALPRLPALQPDRQRDRLFEAVWRCFEALSRVRPLVLILEDIHWAGPATVDLLGYLARRARNHPILVVVTFRDDDTDAAKRLRALRDMLRHGGSLVNVPLGGIDEADVNVLLAAVLGDAHSAPFAKRAHELCSGNPFFLNEIIREWLAAPGASPQTLLSPSLEASIHARIASLSPEAQSLAGIASVVGRAFTIEIIAAAAGTSEADAVRCMDELLDMRLIREPGSEAARSDEFVFSHDLIRSQFYAQLPANVRRRQHRRIGFVLEKFYAQDLDALVTDLARHFDEGGESEKAARYFCASARQALRLYAEGEALQAVCRAADITTDPALRYEVLALRETMHGRAGRRAEQLTDLEALERLSETRQDGNAVFECMRRRLLYARAVDDVTGQQHWIDVLRARAAGSEHTYWTAFSSECHAALMTSLGRYDEALCSAREALALYKAVDDADGTVRSLCLVADISTLRAEPAESQAALEEGTAIAESSGNEASIVRALGASALAAHMSADYERARILAERGLALCRTIGDREGEAEFLFRLGNNSGRRFAVAEATRTYANAAAIYEGLNKPLGGAIVSLNASLLYLKVGDYSEALAALKRARSVFLSVNDLRGLTVCAINLGMVAYLQGRFQTALRLSRKGAELANRLGQPQLECAALGNIGAAERELGQVVSARMHSEEALAQRRRMAPMDIGSDLADMGLTYVRAGDLAAACAIAREIEALSPGALDSVMFPQNVLWSAASAYQAAGLEIDFRRALERALELYEKRLAKIPDGPWRAAYRELPFNRRIRAAGAADSDADRTGTAYVLERDPADASH